MLGDNRKQDKGSKVSPRGALSADLNEECSIRGPKEEFPVMSVS